ncbi:hypothetical protein LQ567_06710 [Niabella pedocola]|uniref:Uncharacterized protein n=1 Tax=Niabella pedocola TaxID=1752077 RepID=A0ABS8PQ52_9BACT|nr:hypothetical protein [Niabella pedocola]MCD2422447.1 hypothetical protein [Niabella pedocola]
MRNAPSGLNTKEGRAVTRAINEEWYLVCFPGEKMKSGYLLFRQPLLIPLK